jgi:hypothetical protein
VASAEREVKATALTVREPSSINAISPEARLAQQSQTEENVDFAVQQDLHLVARLAFAKQKIGVSCTVLLS